MDIDVKNEKYIKSFGLGWAIRQPRPDRAFTPFIRTSPRAQTSSNDIAI